MIARYEFSCLPVNDPINDGYFFINVEETKIIRGKVRSSVLLEKLVIVMLSTKRM